MGILSWNPPAGKKPRRRGTGTIRAHFLRRGYVAIINRQAQRILARTGLMFRWEWRKKDYLNLRQFFAINQRPKTIKKSPKMYGQIWTGAQTKLTPMTIKNNPMINDIQLISYPQHDPAGHCPGPSPGFTNADARNPRPRPMSTPGPG